MSDHDQTMVDSVNAHTIQCWSCGVRTTVDEIRENDGFCSSCASEIDLAEYYPQLSLAHVALQSRLKVAETERAEFRDAMNALIEEVNSLYEQLAERNALLSELEGDYTLMLQMGASEFGSTECKTLRARLLKLRILLKNM